MADMVEWMLPERTDGSARVRASDEPAAPKSERGPATRRREESARARAILEAMPPGDLEMWLRLGERLASLPGTGRGG